MAIVSLDFNSVGLNDEQFYQLCLKNPDTKLEFVDGTDGERT